MGRIEQLLEGNKEKMIFTAVRQRPSESNVWQCSEDDFAGVFRVEAFGSALRTTLQVFRVELDFGKLWRRGSPKASTSQKTRGR